MDTMEQADHDLLIRVDTRMQDLGTRIDNYHRNHEKRIFDLESGGVTKQALIDMSRNFEKMLEEFKKDNSADIARRNRDDETRDARIRKLELWGARIAGGLAIIQFVIGMVIAFNK